MSEINHKNQENPLGYESIGKLLRMFALPSVIAMLVNAIYNIVDQIFIGQGVGYLGNAATTVAFPIVSIILAIATLIGAGGSAYAAIKLGENRKDEAQQTLGNVLTLSLIGGICLSVFGLIFLKPILVLFGATAANMDYAVQYAAIIFIGLPFNVLGVSLSNMARTDGSPALSMYSIIIGAVLNCILDPLYIFVFHWGVGGAAIATISSQILSAVVLLIYFGKFGKSMRFHKANLRLQPYIVQRILSLGISSCITQSAQAIMQIVLNNSLVHYGDLCAVTGDVALSAMGIVSKISMIIVSVCIGIGIGSQPIMGFNRGAKQPRRIKQTFIMAVTIATAVVLTGWALCESIPDVILKLFGEADVKFTAFAIKAMRIYLFGIFTAGFQIVTTNYFQATGQPLKASILSTLRQLLLLIPLLLILPLFFGLDGVLYAGPIADISSGIIVFCFAVHEIKKLNHWIDEVEQTDENTKSLLTA